MERNLPRLRMPMALVWATLLFTCFNLVAVAQQQRPFITKWKTDNAGESITIPINDNVTGYNYSVDWGDGNTSVGQTGTVTHRYTTGGTYTVTISGNFPAIHLGFQDLDVTDKLVSIEQWGDIAWKSMERAFSSARNMVLNATDVPDLSGVSSLAWMFHEAHKVNGDLSRWDVSGITDMTNMFYNASAFNGNVSNWNVSNVTNMRGMFWQASVFNQDISEWQVGNVQDMSYMFYQAPVFNQDLSKWNVANVTTMNSMFFVALAFDQSLGSWDISSVTNMDDMLASTGLSPENYSATLIGWAGLATVPSNVILGAGGLKYCAGSAAAEARRVLDEDKQWSIFGDTESADCDGGGEITPGDPGNFVTIWEYSDIGYGGQEIVIPTHPDKTYNYAISWEFVEGYGNSGMEANVTGDFTIPTGATPTGGTIRVEIAGEFPGIFLQKFRDETPDIIELASRLRSIEQWGDIEWETMEGAFTGAYNLQLNATDIPDLSKVKSLAEMFDRASEFTGNSSMGNWNVENVEDMEGMFSGTQFDQPIGTWDVSNVTDMQSMFTATPFNQDISKWDVSKVTSMYNMFALNYDFNQNIGEWEVGQVTDMGDMFRNATAFNQDLSRWDVSNVTSMLWMFYNATSFDQDLGDWTIGNVADMEDMLNGSGMSTANYDATLIGWAEQEVIPQEITLGAEGITYCASAAARAKLETEYEWNFTDGGQAADCTVSNQPPTVTGLPAAISFTEDEERGAVNIASSTFADADDEVITVRMTVSAGRFSLSASGGSPIELGGNNTSTVTLKGTSDIVNQYLGTPTNVTYTPPANLNGNTAATLTINASDGSGEVELGVLPIHIEPVNDAPEVTLPAALEVSENTATALTGISFADVDAGTGALSVSLRVPAGTLTANSGGGVTVSGNGPNALSLSGSLADINTFFAASNVTFLNVPGNTDTQTLSVAINDNGNTGDGGSLSAEVTVPIRIVPAVGPGNPDHFVTVWKTDNEGISDPNRVTIPATGAFTYTWVDVNDSSSAGSGSGNGETIITFPEPGTYEVRIAPTGSTPFHHIQFFQLRHSDKNKLLEVKNWGNIHWTKFQFNDCANLKITATDVPDLSGVTDLSFAFSHSGIDEVPNINDWDVSTVTDLSNLFEDVTGFNQSLSDWDVSNVTTMNFMFDGATSFNQPLDSWDVRKLESFSSMFRDASSFDQSLAAWQLESFGGSVGAFVGSGMSCENFSYSLYGWATNPNTNDEAILGGSGVTYSPDVAPYVDKLRDERNWRFQSLEEGTCSVVLPDPSVIPDANDTLYVDIDVDADAADYTGDGSSWTNALPYLSDALKAAETNPDIQEIHVAEGTYYPTGEQSGTDREETFAIMRGGLALYGGYPQGGGTRDVESNPTILSGDIGEDGNMSDNSYHVMVIAGVGETAGELIVDGFTVTAGRASYEGDGSYIDADYNGHMVRSVYGAGLYAVDVSPNTIIRNSVFSDHVSGSMGGAIFLNDASLTLRDLHIDNNTAEGGGGICVDGVSTPLLEGLHIANNEATGFPGGGGLYVNGVNASPVVRNAVISGNTATMEGGGINISSGSGAYTNVLITGNRAEHGGGVSSSTDAEGTFAHVTISGNAASQGGGIYSSGAGAQIVNSIIKGNSADEANEIYISGQGEEDFHLSFSLYGNAPDDFDLQGGFSSSHNLIDDPQFVNAPAASTAPFTGGNYQLEESSPAINAGSNAAIPDGVDTDIAGNPRIHELGQGGMADLGAYESVYGNAILPNAEGIVYVDSAIATPGDGSSWETALRYLSDATQASRSREDIKSIWVAAGTYYPTREQSSTNRSAYFDISRPGLRLLGGYPHGGGSQSPRNNETILSGYIGIAGDMSDNSYHVLVLVGKGDDTNPDTDGMTVDGFTITGGNANGEGTFMDLPPLDELPGPSGISVANGHGGGMLTVNLTRSTTIEQVTFKGNEALGGAGMANYNSSPSLLRCRFEDNRMVTDEESSVFLSCGGGMLNIYASAPMVRQTTFTGNSSPLGGAMANMMLSSPTIFNSTFTGNRSNSVSALVDMLGSGSLVANSVFTDHEIIASDEAIVGIQPATIANLQGGNSQLINSTVANNHGATAASAEHAALRVMANPGGGGSEDAPTVTVTNTIIYGNDGDEGVSTESGGTATVTYSLVQGMEADDELHLLDGDTDPLFMDAEGGDYHLQPSSPAMDKGLDSAVPSGIEVDRDGGARKVGTAVDLGAYEAQESAMEITIEPWWGEDFTLDVEGSDSFQQVKQKIQDIKGVDPDIQMLRHEGRLLEDGRTLADFEIESGDVLQLTHVPTPNGNTIYVDIEVDKDGDGYTTGAGDSWENAVPELADVLQWARLQHDARNPDWNETNPLRIFVAEGLYKPLYNVADDDYTADGGRENSFVMVPNVQLYGGFDPQEGIETLDDDRILPDRAPLGSEELVGTVLSGDLLGNDGDDFANNSENAYHVLVASGNLGGARLDGFTVTGGNANRYELFGPSVLGYSVWRNMGGGIFDCSDLTIAHCHITRNTTSRYGGGIYHHDLGPLTLWNSRVTDNQSGDWGGGVYSSGGSLSMVNVEVSGNSAANAGGGIYNFRGDALLTNVTVFDNASSGVSGVHMRENTTLYNSVILDPITTDNLEEGTGEGTLSVITVNNSLLKYAIPSENIGDGSGDYTVDPELDAAVVFTDPASGDYTLIENSPAIDMGDNAFYTAAAGDLEADLDLAGNPRVYNQADGGIIDLGAYEYQGERTFISQLAVPAAVTVDYGTAWNAIEGLPTTVTATLSDDTEVSIPLDGTFANWTLVTPAGGSYDGEVAGSYVYNVPLAIPTDATYLNPDNLQAQVTVTVAKGTPVLAVLWDGAAVDATEGLALTYGDSGELSGTSTDADGTLAFAFGSDQTAVLDLADMEAVAAQQAGTATLTVSQAATDNYEAASVDVVVTVAKKAITIVPTAGQGKVYGAAEPDSYGYTLAEDESLAFDDELTDIVSVAAREAGEIVGGYDIILTLDGTLAANYDVTFEADNDAFVITPLEITLTADNQTKVFGTDDPSLTYAYTPELIGTDEFTGALTREEGERVGSYAITQGNLSLSDNYTLAFTASALTITAAELEDITFNDLTTTYDGTEHQVALAGDLPAGASVAYTVNGAAGNGATAAGVYDVTALIDGGDNYEDAELTATLTIAPLEITVTADNQTKVFGTDDPALTYTFEPELIGTDEFTGALTREEGEYVGSYAITQGNLSLSDNYTMAFTAGTLTITSAAFEGITFNDLTTTYDGTEHRVALAGDLPAGASVAYTIDGTRGNGATAAGVYDVTALIDGGDNYEDAALTATLTIAPLEIVVTADNRSKAFGTDDPSLTYTYMPELIGTDEFTGALTREVGENVGSYAITQGNLSISDNYTVAFTVGTLTIERAEIPGVAFENTSFTYDGTEHRVALAGDLPAGASVAYTIDGARGNGATDAGVYEVTALVDGGDNYEDAALTATLTIAPLEITVTADNQTKVFGTDDPALTYTYKPELIGTDGFTGALTRSEGENVGSYAITQGNLSLSDNYTLAFTAGTLTITSVEFEGITFNDLTTTYDGTEHRVTLVGDLPAGASVAYTIDGATGNGATDAGTYEVTALIDGGDNYEDAELTATLTITPLEIVVRAENQTKIFGTDDPALRYTFEPELIGNDVFAGALTREAGEDVGSYAITQGNLSLADNYALAFTAGTLTITSTEFEGITFNDLTTTYDGAEHRVALAGDLPAGTSVAYTIDGATGNGATDAGVYEVTAQIDGGVNYEDAELSAILTIAPLEITVRADNQTKVYGTDDPSLTYTFEPELIGTDVFAGVLTREAGEDVGNYAIGQGDLLLDENYVIVFESSMLTITPKAILDVTLENTSFTYDGTEHRLTLTGDLPVDASVAYEIDDEVGNGAIDAGVYEVTAHVDGGSNYDDVMLTATLTITPAERTLNFPALPVKAYGDDNFEAGATASSGESVSYTSSHPEVAEVDGDGTITITGAGTVTITATVPENGNYSSRPSVSRTLTVNKATQTITFNPPSELNRDAGTVPLEVSASSGLPVELMIDDEEVATLNGTDLNVLRLGTVRITATQSGDGNHESAEPVTVTVRVVDPEAELPVRVSKVVSPNGDGINEYLIIEGVKDYPENKVTVFNRNGTIIWEGSGYNNGSIAFRGIGTGQYNVPAGTYFYVAEIRVNGEWKYEKGWFVLRY